MSIRKLTYEIARDIQSGKITLEGAMATWGQVIDRDDLEDVLASLGSVTDNEDGTVTIRVPDSWERTWSEEDPPA
jgi:hypothetical protein